MVAVTVTPWDVRMPNGLEASAVHTSLLLLPGFKCLSSAFEARQEELTTGLGRTQLQASMAALWGMRESVWP